MKVKILASESMGVRSMATFIKTDDVGIIIDPSCTLCPRRFGLPPHKLEIEEREKRLRTINAYLKLSDIAIITHYHYDHFTNENAELYENKTLLAKDPLNFSHAGLMQRAKKFFSLLNENTHIKIADNKTYKFGHTEIVFSGPLHHGNKTSKVYVLSVCIKNKGTVFLHTSDIQGINTEEQLDFITKCQPDILFLDGFPLYLIGKYYTKADFENSVNLLTVAARHTQTLIIDHHFTRSEEFRNLLPESIQFVTAATFMNEKEKLLEARRKELYSL